MAENTNATDASKTPSSPDNGDNGGKNGGKKPDVAALVSAGIFWGVVLLVFAWNYLGVGDPELEIVVAASPSDTDADGAIDSWSVTGHVLYDDDFVPGIGVWAVAVDQQGNRKSSGKSLTDASGMFDLASIPNSLSGQPNQSIVEIDVYARGLVDLRVSE